MTEAVTITVDDCDVASLTDADAWDAFVKETGAEIYFLSDWQAAWWPHFGAGLSAGRRPCTIRAYAGGALVGALPFCIETIWIGPVPVRVARLAGVDPSFAVVGLPLAAERAEAVLALAIDHLLGAGCAVVSFAPVSSFSDAVATLKNAPGASRMGRMTEDNGHTLMHLPEEEGAFVGQLSKSRRREIRRDIKRLDEIGASVCKTSTGPLAQAALDRFIVQHTAQWEAMGKGGHFADWPMAEGFHRALMERLSPKGLAGVDEHWMDARLLSSQLRYNLGGKAYWWLIARTDDPAFASVGLGRVGLVARVGGLTEMGITTVEAGAGRYAYKSSYGGEFVPVHNIALTGAGMIARAKAGLLFAWSDLVHLIYYRVWFLKVRPKLKVKRRALWGHWVRTRL